MPSGWRLIRLGAEAAPVSSGAYNMAIDQALLEGVAAGAAPAVRFYRWRPACLSFGRNQPALGQYDPVRVAALGCDVVRRPTGGLAVLHDAELTYAVVAPVGLLGGPRATYEAINRALAAGLCALGVPAALAGGARRGAIAAFAGAHPCFAAPAAGEVVVGARKLVGSAQRVERRTVLQHGSILLDGTQAVLHQLRVGGAAAAPAVGATSIREVLGRVPGDADLVSELARGCEGVFGTSLAPAPLDAGEAERARDLEARFTDPKWTWRR